jgi:Flp pilus assembly protein TadG
VLRSSNQRGSMLVEQVVVLVVLLAFMLGVVDFSRALYAYHFVSHAAREATRYAMVRGSSCTDLPACPAANSDITAYVRGVFPPGIQVGNSITCGASTSPNELIVCATWPGTGGDGNACDVSAGDNSPGCVVNVEVEYNFQFILPWIADAFHFRTNTNTYTMTSSSQIVISQ